MIHICRGVGGLLTRGFLSSGRVGSAILDALVQLQHSPRLAIVRVEADFLKARDFLQDDRANSGVALGVS